VNGRRQCAMKKKDRQKILQITLDVAQKIRYSIVEKGMKLV